MKEASRPAYHFGDLLALTREHWVRQMADHLAAAGFEGYRRSDAAAMRLLSHRPWAIGALGEALAVSRQAARKLVSGLERRGLATTARDARDARQLNVRLTPRGVLYAQAIAAAIDALDRRLAARVEPAQLLAADAVLRATLPDGDAAERVARLVPPP